ncbi:hypothetical protein O8C96_04345 [Aliarcobacter butzleri]|uniref:hypothetical protein n=1 Tax=Aliarcobacter butzleri TaxID=28197 RepID=UPI00263EFACA|nr:hypothetical protein [Aliarcobacter butzleri]MDN5044951.1 hypothetical protein [Aliarcobacter butzleri]
MQQTTKIDHSKILNDEDIELELEPKLKGLIFILDSLELNGDDNHIYQANGFYTIKTIVSSILQDTHKIKENIEYMYQTIKNLEN